MFWESEKDILRPRLGPGFLEGPPESLGSVGFRDLLFRLLLALLGLQSLKSSNRARNCPKEPVKRPKSRSKSRKPRCQNTTSAPQLPIPKQQEAQPNAEERSQKALNNNTDTHGHTRTHTDTHTDTHTHTHTHTHTDTHTRTHQGSKPPKQAPATTQKSPPTPKFAQKRAERRADGSFVLVHQTQDRLFQYACLFECLFSSALAFFDEFEAMIRFILAALI